MRDSVLKVLLVEDNEVNQLVAVQMLQKLNLICDTVQNGLEAVGAVRDRHYDLIFMDCQMPVLDGYEATRMMRQEGIRIPIIAMTAHAMRGDEEKCLEAGMDEYLAKPIALGELREMVERYLPQQESVVRSVDLARLELITEGDRDLRAQLVEIFRKDSRLRLLELSEALESKDGEGALRLAHTLKGSAANMGAEAMAAALAKMELALKNAKEMEAKEAMKEASSAFEETARIFTRRIS